MKFCTKCGNEMSDEMAFCQKCGTKSENSPVVSDPTEVENISEERKKVNQEPLGLRGGMKVWMIIFFVFAGVFAVGSMTDASMLAGVCLFGILGTMFLVLAKTPKGQGKVLSNVSWLQKTQGIPKGAFVGICVVAGLCLFVGIINTAEPSTVSNSGQESQIVEQAGKEPEKKPAEEKPAVPEEFAEVCPVSISLSLYDNIIGLPELTCSIQNQTEKEISAIQLYFAPKDVYGENADGIFSQNKLYTDKPIAPNGSYNGAWQLIDDSVKSGDVYVYSVYFADGTEWGDRSAPLSKIKKYGLKMSVSY